MSSKDRGSHQNCTNPGDSGTSFGRILGYKDMKVLDMRAFV
jgi:hypothetical protein